MGWDKPQDHWDSFIINVVYAFKYIKYFIYSMSIILLEQE